MIGYIYRISSEKIDKIYIGSTILPIHRRLILHKSKTKQNINNCLSRLIVCYDDAIIECIEEVALNYKKDIKLKQRERYYIELNKDNVVNKQKPLRTKKEYADENKDYFKQLRKEHYEANKDIISLKQKEYREANKDIINERGRKYNQANKDKIAERRNKKVSCECGALISKSNLLRHKRESCKINIIK